MTAPAEWTLALTYAAHRGFDGVGAQLLRIMGVYAASRKLGLPYVHTGLGKVGNQGLLAAETRQRQPGFVLGFNRAFDLPSDVVPPAGTEEVQIDHPSIEEIQALEAQAREQGRRVLLRVLLPYRIIGQQPDAFEVCRRFSPFLPPERAPGPVRIAMHVRRGDILKLEQFRHRLRPNSHYIEAARLITDTLDAMGVRHVVQLHTEESALEPETAPGFALSEFDVLPGLVRRINEKTARCLAALTRADVLITSVSAFSYLAAITNRRESVVLYTPFDHRPMSHWISCDAESGVFPREQVARAVRAWVEGRRARRAAVAG